jgi:hypothetical protein
MFPSRQLFYSIRYTEAKSEPLKNSCTLLYSSQHEGGGAGGPGGGPARGSKNSLGKSLMIGTLWFIMMDFVWKVIDGDLGLLSIEEKSLSTKTCTRCPHNHSY